jgi:uncharacterized protein (TIGR03492 family)
MKLLCLSNGHGEDAIATRILQQLQQLPNAPDIAALPIVGEGYAYQALDIPIVAKAKNMPSGGFIYMDNRQLWRDLRGGLIQLTWAQSKAVRKWGKSGGVILAVGDIFPLLLAWLSGANYAFVGTAKSEYYLRDEAGWLPQTSKFERYMGSVYLPWERWLMKNKRCQGVFPRDRLTTEALQDYGINAYDFGNPMMDGIADESPLILSSRNPDEEEAKRPLKILLLPGSRPPEAYENWEIILAGVQSILEVLTKREIVLMGAIAPTLDLDPLRDTLTRHAWTPQPLDSLSSNPLSDSEALAFRQRHATLLLSQNAYIDCLRSADIALAMAGTATEQFVGLGKPVITFAGKGPQFTPAFAEAQTRLLGVSVLLTPPEDTGQQLQQLLRNPDYLQQVAQNGQRRMGRSGSAEKIAQFLMENLCKPT